MTKKEEIIKLADSLVRKDEKLDSLLMFLKYSYEDHKKNIENGAKYDFNLTEPRKK